MGGGRRGARLAAELAAGAVASLPALPAPRLRRSAEQSARRRGRGGGGGGGWGEGRSGRWVGAAGGGRWDDTRRGREGAGRAPSARRLLEAGALEGVGVPTASAAPGLWLPEPEARVAASPGGHWSTKLSPGPGGTCSA